MKTHTSIRCPSCAGAMRPIRLKCDACDLTVSGRFGVNEFATLGEDDLHFLRIFVVCEGRIRDMESALGVSYPTIKTRMAKLKETLAAKTSVPSPLPANSTDLPKTFESTTAAILKDLEAGRHTYTQAMEKLRQIQKDNPS